MKTIDQFSGQYFFLSNFYPCEVTFYGLSFPSAEAAFQAAKCADPVDRARFLTLTPSDAQRLSRRITPRPDWDRIKLTVMNNILVHKFHDHPHLGDKLLETGAAELIEGNIWHDNFWGNCTCPRCIDQRGQNYLGRLLMRLRADKHMATFSKT